MQLFVIGLSHRTAPVAVRERLAMVPGELEARLRHWRGRRGCARRPSSPPATGWRSTAPSPTRDAGAGLGARALCEALAAAGRRPAPRIPRRLRAPPLQAGAARGRPSPVPGGGQPGLAGDRRAADPGAGQGGLRSGGCGWGPPGRCWAGVFRAAFRVARKVRRDTAIARPVSVSSVAVDLARQFWDGFAGRQVLMIGAGKMADLAARALSATAPTWWSSTARAARAEELAGAWAARRALGRPGRGAGPGRHRHQLDRGAPAGAGQGAVAEACKAPARRGRWCSSTSPSPATSSRRWAIWRGSTSTTSTTCRRW